MGKYEELNMLSDRLIKAIKFFREFQSRSDKELYRKSVLKFCDMVEEYIKTGNENIVDEAKKIFADNQNL